MKKTACWLLSLMIVILSAVPNDTAYAFAVKKDGYYYTAVQSNKPSYGGEYIKKVRIKGNKITTYGSYSYGKQAWGGKRIGAKKRTFKLSKKCNYYDSWGTPTGKKRISKKRAMKYLKGNLYCPYDSATCCIFKVKNKTVVAVMFGQA